MSVSPPDTPPLVELGPVPEFWVDGAKAERLGSGVYRLIFYKVRKAGGDGPSEQVVQVEVLLTLANMSDIVALLHTLASGFLGEMPQTPH